MAVPGIEGYLDMRPLRLAEAVMSGYQAGASRKRDREAKAEREQARADRLAEQQSRLLQEFGPDAVIEPESGAVDINRSALARQKRLESEAIAEAIGEQESISGFSRSDVDQSIRQNPGYLRGQARGAARRAQEEATIRRWTEVEQERTKQAIEREKIKRDTELEKTILEDVLKEPKAEKKPAVKWSEKMDGKEFSGEMTPEEYAAMVRERAAKLAEDEDPFAVAKSKVLEAQKSGKGIDLEMRNGVPVVEPSWIFDTPYSQALQDIETLRQKSQPRRATNAPIRIEELLRRR